MILRVASRERESEGFMVIIYIEDGYGGSERTERLEMI